MTPGRCSYYIEGAKIQPEWCKDYNLRLEQPTIDDGCCFCDKENVKTAYRLHGTFKTGTLAFYAPICEECAYQYGFKW